MFLRPVIPTLTLAFALQACVAHAADAPPAYYEAQLPQQAPAGYQDCITHSCKLVPDVKHIKKTVYEVKEEPFCVKKLPPLWSLFCQHQCAGEICPDCQCPRYRKIHGKKRDRLQRDLHDQMCGRGARRARAMPGMPAGWQVGPDAREG